MATLWMSIDRSLSAAMMVTERSWISMLTPILCNASITAARCSGTRLSTCKRPPVIAPAIRKSRRFDPIQANDGMFGGMQFVDPFDAQKWVSPEPSILAPMHVQVPRPKSTTSGSQAAAEMVVIPRAENRGTHYVAGSRHRASERTTQVDVRSHQPACFGKDVTSIDGNVGSQSACSPLRCKSIGR